MRSRTLRLKGRTKSSVADVSRPGLLRLETLEPRQLLSTVYIPPVIIGDLGPDQTDDPLTDVTDVYVTLGDNAAKSLSFVDENDTQVMVKYKGGTAQLHLVGEDLVVAEGKKVVVTGAAAIESIVLDGNDAASQLTVKAGGGNDNLTTVGSITGTGDLKKISAGQVDLDGAGLDLTNGCVASLALHDLVGGADLNLPGGTVTKGVAVSLNQIGPDSDILLGSPAKKFSALNWQSGGFQLPWANKVSFDGDMGANVQVTGQGVPDGKPAVAGLDIGGTLSGDLDIQGDVSKASLGGLSGDVSISGNAKNIGIDEYLGIVPPEGGAQGSLFIGGTGAVTSTSEKLNVENATMYVTQEQMYQLEALRQYDQLEASWTYEAYTDDGPDPVEVTISVSADTQDNNGHDVYTVTLDASQTALGTLTTGWSTDQDGTYVWSWNSDSAMGVMTVDIDSALVVPAEMVMGQEYTATATITGGLAVQDPMPLAGNIAGTIEVTTELVGHEMVSTPLGDFLAAQVEMVMVLEGVIQVEVQGMNLNLPLEATMEQTFWFVADPQIGAVQIETSLEYDVGGGMLGEASDMELDMMLTAYDI